MAFIKDILNVIGDDCLNYQINILGEKGLICEGFSAIAKFSTESIVLRVGRVMIGIQGIGFKILQLAEGYLEVSGSVTSVSRLDSVIT